jgi:DNA gyrase/topoisomerase IV subunit B
MAKTYSSDNIKVLSDREHIQLRKAMYIGDAQDPRTLLSEIIDNALDECQAGYSEAIIVSMDTKKHKYEVRDYGRGIPHGKKELNGEMKETLEILLTKSNSGGKFDNSAYTTSSGLHGLGITITNALSKHICIISYRKGKYVQGEAKGTDEVKIKYGKSDEPDGTYVTFEPDGKFFPTVDIPVSFMKDRCRIASALGFKTRLIVDGEEINTDATMFDLMKEEDAAVSTYVQIEPISVTSSVNETMKVAIKYTSETNDRYFGYTNLLVNYLGGTHVQELSKTIIATWKEFIEKHKNIKPAIELHNNDYLVGLRAVCAVFISNPEFSSQTKEKLVVNKKYFEELMQLFSKQLYKYLHDHADLAHQLVKRFEQYRAAQNALLSQKEIGSLIKINEESGDNIRRRSIVSKLVDCTSKKRDQTELFLCLAGDTLVKLTNGKHVPIQELVGQENIWLYSTNQFGNFTQARMLRAFQTRTVRKLLRVHFSNGTHVDCTHEHKFLENHTLIWIEAQNLKKWHQIHCLHGAVYVVNIEELYFDEDVPVYCLEIDSDEHSFVLGNGVVTHNCEGDSALGGYLYTRNKELQAVLPLKGKILNVTFKSIKEAVQNSEICDIANAIGCGIGASCDALRSRYDKIIISSDADEDGKHITSLLASLFVNLFPDLVKEGKVWIALPPLYSWGDNPKNFGWCNDIKDIPKQVKTFHRFKGLGEMQPEQLKYYCVDPDTRRQIQLEFPSDIDEFNRIVGSSQGKNDLLKELGIIEEGR